MDVLYVLLTFLYGLLMVGIGLIFLCMPMIFIFQHEAIKDGEIGLGWQLLWIISNLCVLIFMNLTLPAEGLNWSKGVEYFLLNWDNNLVILLILASIHSYTYYAYCQVHGGVFEKLKKDESTEKARIFEQIKINEVESESIRKK